MKKPPAKCEDFYIVSLRIYADSHLSKNSDKYNEQHQERAVLYHKWLWEFIEQVTKKDFLTWVKEFWFSKEECAFEEMRENHNIHIANREKNIIVFIPKQNTFMIDWVNNNTKLPFKILKKTNMWAVVKIKREKGFFKKLSAEYSNPFRA